MIYERDIIRERGVINLDTGVMNVTSFTNGNASDGHIIHVKGLESDLQLSMFINHDADPTRTMGGLTKPRLKGNPMVLGGQRLRHEARIDMGGDGAWPDVRRDVARQIEQGNINGMSGRWEELEPPKLRSELDASHYAFTKAGANAYSPPLFFPSARILEVSIVGVPADQAAVIGRSQDLSSPAHVRDFYKAMAQGDPMTREQALTCLFEEAGRIEGLVEVESESCGRFYVPRQFTTGDLVVNIVDSDCESIDEPTAQKLLERFNKLPQSSETVEASDEQVEMIREVIAQTDSREAAEPETTQPVQPEPLAAEAVRTHAYAAEVQAIERGADERYAAKVALAQKQLRYRHLGN